MGKYVSEVVSMVGFIICMSVLFILVVTGIWAFFLQRNVMNELKDESKHIWEEIEKERKTNDNLH